MDSIIRAATTNDALEMWRLYSDLGHPTAVDKILSRWDAWEADGNSAIVASVSDRSLAGFVTLHRMTVLHRPMSVGRITSLVVDVAFRGQGTGRRLVTAAKEKLAQLGCGLLEVTSHARHANVYDFYLLMGYEQTGVRFAKTLAVG